MGRTIDASMLFNATLLVRNGYSTQTSDDWNFLASMTAFHHSAVIRSSGVGNKEKGRVSGVMGQAPLRSLDKTILILLLANNPNSRIYRLVRTQCLGILFCKCL